MPKSVWRGWEKLKWLGLCQKWRYRQTVSSDEPLKELPSFFLILLTHESSVSSDSSFDSRSLSHKLRESRPKRSTSDPHISPKSRASAKPQPAMSRSARYLPFILNPLPTNLRLSRAPGSKAVLSLVAKNRPYSIWRRWEKSKWLRLCQKWRYRKAVSSDKSLRVLTSFYFIHLTDEP